MELLEQRVAALEKKLGLPDHPDAKTKDVDVYSLRKSLVDRGFKRVYSIPIGKLKALHKLTYKTESRPLLEKLNAIQFCEDLIAQRAEHLKEFEEMVKVVLESESIAAVSHHEAALEAVTKEISDAVWLWRECDADMEDYRQDVMVIISTLRENVILLEKKVSEKEKKRKN